MDEQARYELSEKLGEVLGREPAATLMACLPPDRWDRLATKADLDPFATKADLDPFATKADLERFATKADLERFATKADLERFATKADLEPFATKADLERFPTREELERFATKGDLNEVHHRFEVLDHRLEAMEHRITSAFRAELNAAVTAQSRTMLVGLLGTVVAMGSFLLVATGIS